MPNWCECSITIEGNDEGGFFAHLIDAITMSGGKVVSTDDGETFNTEFKLLNTYYPIPVELVNTQNVFVSKPQLSDRGEPSIGETINKERLSALYGATDWYRWCIANWGTKWDVSDLLINTKQRWLSFQSAWAPPVEWLKKVSQDFPATQFRIAYCESGNYYAGHQTIQDGQELAEFIFTDEWWEASEGEDDSYEMTQALDNFLVENNLMGVGG